MRILFILILALTVSTVAYADWYYLVNSENQVLYKQDGPAKQENLDKDGLIQIISKEDIPLLEAEYRDGKVIKHKKTQAEIKADNDKQTAIQDKEQKKQSAINKLKSILTDDEIKALFN